MIDMRVRNGHECHWKPLMFIWEWEMDTNTIEIFCCFIECYPVKKKNFAHFSHFYFLWTDFVISNFFFYRFSGPIRTFYPVFNFCRSADAVCRQLRFRLSKWKFVRPIFGRCFQVRDFSFWLNGGIGLTGVSFLFYLKNKFRRVAAIWIFGSFFISTWNIDQF
jgi:hypothetical protein